MDIDDEMVSDMCLDGTVLHDGLCRFTFSTPWLQILMGSFVPIRGVVGSLDGFLKTLLSWIVFIFNRCREPTSPEIIRNDLLTRSRMVRSILLQRGKSAARRVTQWVAGIMFRKCGSPTVSRKKLFQTRVWTARICVTFCVDSFFNAMVSHLDGFCCPLL